MHNQKQYCYKNMPSRGGGEKEGSGEIPQWVPTVRTRRRALLGLPNWRGGGDELLRLLGGLPREPVLESQGQPIDVTRSCAAGFSRQPATESQRRTVASRATTAVGRGTGA
jgi:hypothetical protein